MSTLTLQQALDQLRTQPGQYNSVEALHDLAKQVNVNATGDVTILYSGQTTLLNAKGEPLLSPQEIIKNMELNGESVRVIDNTDAAKFLESREFKEALAPHYGLAAEDLDTKIADLSPAKKAALESMNNALYDGSKGPWADVSGRFVDATVGEVRTFTGGASADRVFGQTEVPRALANDMITN